MHLLTCQTIDLRPRQPSSQKDKPHPSGILLDFSLTSSLFYKVNHSSEFLRLQVCPSEPFYCNGYERLLSSLGVNHGGFFSFYEWAPLFVPNSQCSVSFGGQSPSWVQGLPLADCLATTWPLERFPCLLLFHVKKKNQNPSQLYSSPSRVPSILCLSCAFHHVLQTGTLCR